MNFYSKGSYLRVGFNKMGNCEDWKQSGGTGITITKHIAARKDKEGSGFDPTGMDKWSWVRIEGKTKERTVFTSAYRSCKNRSDLNSIWNQQERFFKSKNKITSPDVQMLF